MEHPPDSEDNGYSMPMQGSRPLTQILPDKYLQIQNQYNLGKKMEGARIA